MTKKPNPLEDPPTASSSEDDEAETSSGEDEGSSSEEEDDPKPPSATATKPTVSSAATKPTVSAAAKKPTVSSTATKPTVSAAATNQKSDSDSGSGSGSGSETETESDSEADEGPKNPNPGSAKSMAAATNPKKKEAVSSSATLALAAAKSGTKRPSEGTSRDDGNAKRAKKDNDDTKKPAFQRLWSEADEIALLQAMIDFTKEKGKSPYDDTNQFYDYVKKLISFEVSKNQLMDKLRGLKNKYLGKEKNGKEVSFTKPHDVEAYALVKSIWGAQGMALESAKSNGKSQSKMKKLESVKQDLFSSVSNVDNKGLKVEMSDWFEDSFLVRSIAGFGVDERTVKQGWRSAPVEAKKKIEAGMKALRAKEIEYLILKSQFLNEAVSMIAEAIKDRDM